MAEEAQLAHPISGDYRIDALLYLQGNRWNPGVPHGTGATVTFSFPSLAPSYANSTGATGFEALNTTQRAAVRTLFQTISQQVGIDFVEVADTGGAATGGQIRVWNSAQASSQAQSTPPPAPTLAGAATFSGDAYFSTRYAGSLVPGTFSYWLIPHVLGHTLGLENAGTAATSSKGNYLGTAENQLVYTAMSLVAHEQSIYNDGLAPYDLLALRWLYGSRAYHVGDDTYQFDNAQGTRIGMVVDDGGTDTLDFSAVTAGLDLHLQAGGVSSVGLTAAGEAARGNFALALDAGIENVTGGSGDDVIAGNALNNSIVGGAGIDTAVFAGALLSYAIGRAGSGWVVADLVAARDAVDTVAQVETLQFADVSVDLTIAARAAGLPAATLTSLIELYIAFFNRVPEAQGLGFWIDQVKAGSTLDQIADRFYGAAVHYADLTGYSDSMTNADFVLVIYKNVLGRDTVDSEGLAFWSGALATGQESRGSLVAAILTSAHTFKGDATYGFVADLLDNKIEVGRDFAVTMGLGYALPELSVSRGMEIAAAVTPLSTAAAIDLIGYNPDAFGWLA